MTLNMDQSPKVSVVIVSWNAKGYLLECLRTVENDLVNIHHETIVVDNASTDGSAEAVEAAWPTITVYRGTTNVGFSAGNNIGIRLSCGEYVCLINSDVEVQQGCFQTLLTKMEECSSAGIVGPRMLNSDNSLQVSYGKFPSIGRALLESIFLYTRANYRPPRTRREVDYLAGSFLLIRRRALQQVGILDEGFFFYSEDVDFCRRSSNHGWCILYVPDVTAIHHGGKSSVNAPVRFYVQQVRARLQYWKKHEPFAAFRWYTIILVLHSIIRVCVNMFFTMSNGRIGMRARYGVRRSVAALGFLLRVLIGGPAGGWEVP